jgi:hypothetical protein
MNESLSPRRRLVYSVKLFAAELSVSERTVWRWISAQKIQTIQITIGRVGIPSHELDRVASQGVQ